ncbi:HEPN domain-containing protein [Compostimonas suwonensis]|uniref:RiboL-PSP-HEPN domain-containing protein n=1 Tax=Compostimonas suwonensis TaxID=1048394 RepID=A0A2M9BTU9_9MICO|nr:hypothetical protein CLV54_2329 [Compostimonas suwonensis]
MLRPLILLIEEPEGVSAEALGWLCRLLVVRSCGHLEQTVKHCLRGYVQEKSGGYVRSFSLTWLEKSRNPTPDALSGVLGRFDMSLSDDWIAFLAENDSLLHDDLSALVNMRNRIAHGENEGLKRERALKLAYSTLAIADWWITSFNPLQRF